MSNFDEYEQNALSSKKKIIRVEQCLINIASGFLDIIQ